MKPAVCNNLSWLWSTVAASRRRIGPTCHYHGYPSGRDERPGGAGPLAQARLPQGPVFELRPPLDHARSAGLVLERRRLRRRADPRLCENPREPADGKPGLYLMAEVRGPGAIVRGWSAGMDGVLRVYLDPKAEGEKPRPTAH